MAADAQMHDAAAVSSALHADDVAFESLYRLHRPIVYAYALSTLRHAADAEDVTQTTFLNAYTALNRGVSPRDDLQWLLAIARNVCRDRFRDANRQPKAEALVEQTPAVEPAETEFTISEICKQISDLNPRQRKILVMREFEGRSYAEISTELGVSQAAVHTLLARARRALRDELELGMTCSQARRVSLRHLNGVAVRDERRALQRHLRGCADCSAFVGRTPRTPVARMLWLVWLPYRRLVSLFAGTSAPAAPAAGGGATLAAKVLAATAIGSTAVGVSVTEVGHLPGFSHHTTAPVRSTSVAPAHRSSTIPGHRHVVTRRTTSPAPVVAQTARHGSARPHVAPSTGSPSPPQDVSAAGVGLPPAEEAPAKPPVLQSSAAPADLPPAEAPAGPAEPAPASAIAAPGEPAPAAAGTTTTPSASPDTADAPSAPPVTDPAPTPPPSTYGAGHPNGNAYGVLGTPPGRAKSEAAQQDRS